jgi:predicted DsbA family dithiol-disulfide isomerase
MKIEVWADIVCPWCYLGKRRLDQALAQHGRPAEVVLRSFQLDPSAPPEYAGGIEEVLRKKGMSRAQVDAAHARLTQLGAEDGIEYHFERTRPGNSLDAHRLLQLAMQKGRGAEMQERLYRAYFTDGTALDRASLASLASELGLDGEQAFSGDAFLAEVRADGERAASLGFRGVPAFLIDERLAISGAQPVATMVAALARAAA